MKFDRVKTESAPRAASPYQGAARLLFISGQVPLSCTPALVQARRRAPNRAAFD